MNRFTPFKFRSIYGLAFVAILSIAMGMVWRGNPNSDAGENQATNGGLEQDYRLTVQTVAIGTIEPPQSFSRFSGIVQARRESQLGFRRAGRVTELTVSEGDQVTRGTIIGRLDTTDLLADRTRLEAELRSATARLRELENGPRAQTIAAAESEVARLKAIVDGAQLRFQRQLSLNRSSAGTQQEFDDARFTLDQAIAALESATQRHNELLAGTRQEQIDVATADLAVIQSKIDRIDVDREDCLIMAPYDGTIANRMIDEGTIVSVAQTAFEFLDTTSLEVRFGLPATWTNDLAIGQTLQVELDGDVIRSAVSAKVLRLHPQVDPITRNRSMDVQMEPNSDVIIGQVVTLRLKQPQSRDNGYWIPTSALAKGSRGLWSVYAIASTLPKIDSAPPSGQPFTHTTAFRIERRDIQIERADGDLTRVTGMIRIGDRIVSDGVHRVSPGVLVRLATHSESDDRQ